MRPSELINVLLMALAMCARAQAQDAPYAVPRTGLASRQDPTAGLFSSPGFCFPFPVYESPLQTTYVTAEAVAFRRDWQRSQTIASLNTPTNAVLHTGDLQFVSQPGLSLSAGRRLNDTFAVELGFVGLLKWDETKAVRDNTLNALGTLGNLFSPFTNFGNPAQAGLDYNSFASIRTASEFNTGELNIRQRFDTPPSCMQASGLYGLRYINVHEQFQYRTSSNSPAPVGTANAVEVETHNSLFGIQAGGTADFHIDPRGWFNIELKGFMCHNSASQDTQFTTGPLAGPGATVTSAAANGRAVFGADVAMSIAWRFTPVVVGRLGYQGLFIDGLALASDNFVRNAPFITTGPADVYRNGHLAFHGPFAGLTATW